MKYAWIGKNKAAWPVTVTCEVLGVSTSGYFEHQRRRQKQHKHSQLAGSPGTNSEGGHQTSGKRIVCVASGSSVVPLPEVRASIALLESVLDGFCRLLRRHGAARQLCR